MAPASHMEARAMMRKSFTVALLLVVPLVLLGFLGVSQALMLYDDFNVKPINPAKWTGSEGNAGPAAPNTETARKLAGKKLYISLTTWGRTDSNTGTAGNQSNRLSVTNPVPVTTIQADVTVKSVKVVGCTANTTPTRSRAQVLGGFFNDGTSPGAGDRTGDILAGIQSTRDTLVGNPIEAFITRCTNAGCTTSTTVFFVTFTASWVQGVSNTMSVQWDKPNKQFIYTLNPGGSQEQHILAYTFSDANPPVVDFKQVAAGNSAASCLGPAPRAYATMKALFDNVMLNP
jgi:hypothetical protein